MNLANNGRLAQANHQDLRKKENEPLSALPRAATAELFWRAKLAGEPSCNLRQMERINLIAFQAAKRPRPTSVNGR